MNRKHLSVFAVSALAILSLQSALAQRAGQSATIRYGIVTSVQVVDLQDGNSLKGALLGGAVGTAVTRSSKSSSRRDRNAAIGAVIGAARQGSKRTDGRLYTVEVSDGNAVKVATEQTEIQMGDCVYVEESGNSANIRRASPSSCAPAYEETMQDPLIVEELQEEAGECAAAKAEVVNAETDDAMDRAVRKLQILCYD